MRNIRRLTGCLPRRSLAMIDHACTNRMHAITIATSRICDYCQHSCAAHRANNMVRFFFHETRLPMYDGQHGECVCKTAHAFISLMQTHAPNPNLHSTILVITHLHETDTVTIGFACCRHSPALRQLLLMLYCASFRVEDRCYHLPNCFAKNCNPAFSKRFCVLFLAQLFCLGLFSSS